MSISSLLIEEKKAMLFVEEARKKAEEILKEARAEADKILKEVSDEEKIKEILEQYERELQREAEKIVERYRREAELVKSVPDELLEKASDMIVREVIDHKFRGGRGA